MLHMPTNLPSWQLIPRQPGRQPWVQIPVALSHMFPTQWPHFSTQFSPYRPNPHSVNRNMFGKDIYFMAVYWDSLHKRDVKMLKPPRATSTEVVSQRRARVCFLYFDFFRRSLWMEEGGTETCSHILTIIFSSNRQKKKPKTEPKQKSNNTNKQQENKTPPQKNKTKQPPILHCQKK